jgi:sterol desaturase/sphingolipid hydroxylase (fatty acid hydroxylase superfamily)
MHCGVLNKVFNTPQLHRWHHSIDSKIGNNNYGENLMLWDKIFGTYYYKEDSAVDVIGIQEKMPANFTKQLLIPFIWNRYQDGGEDADTG